MAIAHRVIGTGPHTVLALHGWMGSSDGWGAFADYLDRDEFRWVFTDNRGYGQRKDVTGGYTLDEVAADVLELADELGTETFSLVGHSMGGAEVLRVLATAPERVRKVVGISPVGAAPTPFDDDSHALFYGAPDNRDNRYGIVDFTTGNRLSPTWINDVVQHSLDNSTVEAFRGALVAWAEADFLDEVAGDETPMLVIPGEHDLALGPETVRQTWEPHFPNCGVEVMTNAGHYAPFETPVALVTMTETFLRG